MWSSGGQLDRSARPEDAKLRGSHLSFRGQSSQWSEVSQNTSWHYDRALDKEDDAVDYRIAGYVKIFGDRAGRCGAPHP